MFSTLYSLSNICCASYIMAGATGLEPATSCVTGRRSNQSWATPPFVNACRIIWIIISNANVFLSFFVKNRKIAYTDTFKEVHHLCIGWFILNTFLMKETHSILIQTQRLTFQSRMYCMKNQKSIYLKMQHLYFVI